MLHGVSTVPQNTSVFIDGRPADGVSLAQNSDGVTLRCVGDQCNQLARGLHSVRDTVGNAAALTYVWKDKVEKLVAIKPFGQNYAIVMAISDYRSRSAFDNLPSAVVQAKGLTTVLQKQGFQVKELYDANATKANFEHYLWELNGRLREDDRVLVYFGGHGFTMTDELGNKQGFLVTSDATKTNMLDKGILMNNVAAQYEILLKARHVFFVLDACFAGLAARDPGPDESDLSIETLRDLDSLSAAPSHSVFAAGDDAQFAVDNSGGIFTKAFIDAIQGWADSTKSGIVTEDQLYYYVRRVVRAEAARSFYKQDPKYSSPNLLGHGQFVFVYR
jgi:hypothetical protein